MLIWTLVILGTVALDQLTKYLTILYLKPVPTVPLWEGVLHLTYVENTGAAFGMMKDQRWIFMTVSTVAIVGLLVFFFVRKPKSRMECLSLAFIIGGGIGNMIDRCLLGYVVDMIDFRLINFAVFNVADSFVCVGVGLMMLSIVRSMIAEYKLEKAAIRDGEEARRLDRRSWTLTDDSSDAPMDMLADEIAEPVSAIEPETVPMPDTTSKPDTENEHD